MTLAEFLLARIAEDEDGARKAQQGRWKLWGYDVLADTGGDNNVAHATEVAKVKPIREDRPDGSRFLLTFNAAHIARWDPARVLAECEAKRRIVEHHAAWAETLNRQGGHFSEEGETCYRMAMRWVVECLAQPYADHPDYRQEWKP